MANPVIIPIPEGGYTKIATNVTTGNVYMKLTLPTYKQTYRITGEAAPTAENESVLMFAGASVCEGISSSFPIDVYVWANKDGSLRVDL